MVESSKVVNDLIFDNKMPIHEEYGIDLTKLAKEVTCVQYLYASDSPLKCVSVS